MSAEKRRDWFNPTMAVAFALLALIFAVGGGHFGRWSSVLVCIGLAAASAYTTVVEALVRDQRRLIDSLMGRAK